MVAVFIALIEGKSEDLSTEKYPAQPRCALLRVVAYLCRQALSYPVSGMPDFRSSERNNDD